MDQVLTNSFSPGKNLPVYQSGAGPISVKVIDPTNVYDGEYFLKSFINESSTLSWKMWRVGSGSANFNDTVYSHASWCTFPGRQEW